MNAKSFVEFASVGMATKAAMAFLAIHVGLDAAAIAYFDVGNAFAHFCDFDTEFVSGDAWVAVEGHFA